MLVRHSELLRESGAYDTIFSMDTPMAEWEGNQADLDAQSAYLDQLELEYDRWDAELTEAESHLLLLRTQIDFLPELPAFDQRIKETYDRLSEGTTAQ
jgi:hypothetical protein